MNSVLIGRRYRHRKGGVYEVLMIASSTETGEPLVVYRADHECGQTWARPLEEFEDGRFEEVVATAADRTFVQRRNKD